ncbi:peptidase M48 Ste24p [Desulfobacter hydrogenophilus]|uniref:Peptidase M48 Ste24p n=1 Tax=Desulfobacter hydrogenophilus TaxID=2291 RepID=A0A328FJ19_9BACT|nr:M48 family metalloprotease [Desulfobacter hydrogenophilus]NDY70847.1 M48 family metalloprotease [Desulfobacter hydrogenophilus]QBH11618.1 twin-arginine translocation signal domain-containing protein [Desulfobacter hydrogenophilus]RAM03163.1 peptidase M48 Ste24p [Desulfobacter hydrogenophilus]
MKQIESTGMTRRDFLQGCAATAVTLAGAGLFQGCAIDPVTGQKQLMLMSRDQEISLDRQQSPFQFSSDYGVTQDNELNRYVSGVGRSMVPRVHRPDMPYNFQVVNATYINAYAFPGGSIAVTRGILLKIDNEAELASLLGHELGHVNARHTAEQQSKGQISSILLAGLSAAVETQGAGLGDWAQKLGGLGQGLFLSKYSRDNEREADALGHQYMARSGYNSKGFTGLMEMLNEMNTTKPSSTQMLFATHPMSRERLDAARDRDNGIYRDTHSLSLYRERYMDHTANLRSMKAMIVKLQDADHFLAKEQYDQAEGALMAALRLKDNDYTAQVMTAKCMLIREKNQNAAYHAGLAKQLSPQENQGHYISGLSNLALKKPMQAYNDFSACSRLLPGNPQTTFYQGYALDMAGKKQRAARAYAAYLKEIHYASNKYSQYAYKQLKAWNYVD